MVACSGECELKKLIIFFIQFCYIKIVYFFQIFILNKLLLWILQYIYFGYVKKFLLKKSLQIVHSYTKNKYNVKKFKEINKKHKEHWNNNF